MRQRIIGVYVLSQHNVLLPNKYTEIRFRLRFESLASSETDVENDGLLLKMPKQSVCSDT